MGLSVGLDVSLESVSICVVDDAGRIVCEARVGGDPEAVRQALGSRADRISQIGLEAGPTSEWIAGRLLDAGLPVVCLETTADDLADLHALNVAQPAIAATPGNERSFPANLRPVPAGWKPLIHSGTQLATDSARSERWNAGACPARGLGHCSACHHLIGERRQASDQTENRTGVGG